MAGSFRHVLDEDNMHYRGYSLLENMGDMKEGVHMMAFMLLAIRYHEELLPGADAVQLAEEYYFECYRGDKPWPEWFAQGNDNDENGG